MKRALICAAILAFAISIAEAQAPPPSLTFTAGATTGVSTATPVLTWSTTPAADACTATGDWTGTKPASGTVTLAPITKSATYNLSCQWGKVSVTATWQAPTTNTDGSPLTDLSAFKVYWTGAGGSFSQSVPGAGSRTLVVSPNPSGTYAYTVTAINGSGTESDKSNSISATTGSTVVNKQVGVTVMPKPSAGIMSSVQ